MKDLPNLATYKRFLWQEANLLVVTGEIGPVLDGYQVYNARYEIEQPRPQIIPVLRKLLAAVTLAAVSLPERESWGWTLAIPDSSVGFFVGVEPEGMICLKTQAVDQERKPVVVQRQKLGEPLKQSHYQPHDSDPLLTIQHYFEEVEQNVVRLAVDDQGKGVLVHVLPGGRFDKVASLDDVQLIELISEKVEQDELKPLADVLIFYECRCHDQMILDMVEKIPEERRKELWGNLDKLEVSCPRCDRKYVIRRKER
jgi:hypothetical protein